MQKTVKLSVVILTYNESEHIAECIKSIKYFDELLVVDSFSNDKTKEIAENLGARVVQKKMQSFAEQRNFAIKEALGEWILFLDADERMTRELCLEIEKVVFNARQDAVYRIKRINYAFGQKIRFGEFGNDEVVRFFPRLLASWEGVVHEKIRSQLAEKTIKGCLIHHTYINWERYFEKFNRYTSMMAEKNYEKGKTASLSKIVINPFWSFLRAYFLKLGFLDGKIGFILAIFHFFYTMAKYVKLDYYREIHKKDLNAKECEHCGAD